VNNGKREKLQNGISEFPVFADLRAKKGVNAKDRALFGDVKVLKS